MINIIAAVSKNNVIGNGSRSEIPWHLSKDLKFFKFITTGYPIIMGRNTLESFGRSNYGFNLLPDRFHIVISRILSERDSMQKGNIEFYTTIEDAIIKAESINDNIFIIGGGEIYKQTIDIADRLYITEIDAEVEGNIYFPEFDKTKFRRTIILSIKDTMNYDIVLYERIK